MSENIEHEGTIVRIENGCAYVLIEQQSACAMCHAKAICAASDSAEKIIETRIGDNKNFAVGDRVMIVGQKSLGMKAVLLAFVVPFFIFMATLYIAQTLTNDEVVSGTSALLSLLPYWAILALFRKRLSATFRFTIYKLEYK